MWRLHIKSSTLITSIIPLLFCDSLDFLTLNPFFSSSRKNETMNNDVTIKYLDNKCLPTRARLAQLVERKALNLVVVGSSPTVGEN
ncbi:hypothetical protein MTR_8g078220 [Medicago truncatula]|uniref:Uncharacterized protein n=1 Tax=Medicago truncatula TaxID=3880 RepID=G7LFJ0_MEDTR|nr:hypothetical protein MTR_8g078220 [Medicago truncatula]